MPGRLERVVHCAGIRRRWSLSGEQKIERGRRAVHIGPWALFTLNMLLESRIATAINRQAAMTAAVADHLPGRAKIEQDDLALVRAIEVARLDVPVQKTLVVHCLQTVQHR